MRYFKASLCFFMIKNHTNFESVQRQFYAFMGMYEFHYAGLVLNCVEVSVEVGLKVA